MRNAGDNKLVHTFATLALMVMFCFCTNGLGQNVVAWGSNAQGQTNVPTSATNVIAVAAGWHHSLALRNDGTLVSWGSIPNVPDEATNVVGIAAGASNNLALKADGSVLCWGDNSWGQTNCPVFPTNVISIAAGNFHILALMADSTVMAWGKNINGQTLIPVGLTNVIAISAGAEHSMALKDDGAVVTWGGNSAPYNTAKNALPSSTIDVAAIGASSTFNLYLYTLGKIYEGGSYTVSPPASASNIVAIATGTNFSLALNFSGRLISWGAGTVTNLPSSATNIIAIAVGLAHALAVKGDGSPHILGSPAFKTVTSAGSYLPLFARAVGKNTLNYQWLADGVPIIGATNALPKVAALWGNGTVAYQVVVSNTIGSVTSSVANVTIRSLNLWGGNFDGQTKIPRSVINPLALAAGPFHNLAIQGDSTVLAWGKNWNGQTNVPAGVTNIIMLAAGGEHSLVLKNDGSVIAWGKNWDSQTDVPTSATNVVAVAAGWAHSVALRADGTVVAWGNNEYGQISVSFLANQVISIAAGYYHTLALRADGRVVSWGYQTDVPASATNIIAIAAGWGHNLALRADGTILGWGDNTFGQAMIPTAATNVIALSAGWYHSMALRNDGTLISWGKAFKYSFITNTPAGLTNIASIDAGEDFSAAIVQTGIPRFILPAAKLSANRGGQLFYRPTIQGSLPMTYQWSHNGAIIIGQTNSFLLLPNAQLSDGGSYELMVSNDLGQTTNQVLTFTALTSLRTYSSVGAWGGSPNNENSDTPSGVIAPVAIAAGDYHNLVLQSDGTIVSTGDNFFGETNIPPNLTNAIAIAAGFYFNVALRSDHHVIAWGRNFEGQTNVPTSATNIIAIAARQSHCLALRSDGTVIAWGNNDYDQTNIPDHLTDVIAISAGYQHNLALRSDHSVISWGSQYLVPASANNVMAIAAGYEHSLALKSDGTIIAWGDNSFGQCNVPASVTNAVAIAAGWWHSLALLDDGHIVVWGQVGAVFTNESIGRFVLVTNIPSGLQNVARIACGNNHDLAMVTYGAPQFDILMPTMAPHVGSQSILVASVGGTAPVDCQWYHDASPISGATRRWLLITNAQPSDAGTYTLVVSNIAGQASSAPAVLAVDSTPYFLTSLPTQQNALVGTAWCFTIDVDGERPLAYQSQLNGGNITDNERISGTASPYLCFNPTALEDSGLLTMIVTNNVGTYTGLVANVAITPVIGWGDNSSGQLQVPASVTSVVSLASGGDHNLALLANGTIAAWGDNSYNQSSMPASANQAVAIAESDTHCLALKSDGSVIAWGDNLFGQTNVPITVQNAVAIAAGTGFSQALMPDGHIIKWGYNSNSTPSTFTNIMLLSTRGNNSVALRADGKIVSSGVVPTSYTNVVSICAGISGGLALQSDGKLVAWGLNNYDQTNIPTLATNMVAISAGDDHFLALRADGIVIAWGNTNFGQCQILALTQSIGSISAGSIHSLAVLGQPLQRAIMAGSSTTFNASQFANRLATYQWQFNGTNITGATNASLILANTSWTNSGVYRVVISNTLGTITSPLMTLSVKRPLFFDPASLLYVVTNSSFKMRLTGASGVYPVVIFSSTNLAQWMPVFTNFPTMNDIDYIDMPLDPSPKRFYRAIEQALAVSVSPGSLFFDTSGLSYLATNGAFKMRLVGASGFYPVVIYTTTNLLDWKPIITNLPTTNAMDFIHIPTDFSLQRFYRAVEKN